MGLVGPWLSTTSTKKRKVKITKSQQEEFERGWRDRNQWLKEMKLPKETFEQYMDWIYGRGKKEKNKTTNNTKYAPPIAEARQHVRYSSGYKLSGKEDSKTTNAVYNNPPGWSGGCTKKPAPTYTGTKIIGIGILHKSCLQPIFSQEEAIEIAKMRR